ncbi:unnamed protein product, partial [Didymodactylos carnosus]
NWIQFRNYEFNLFISIALVDVVVPKISSFDKIDDIVNQRLTGDSSVSLYEQNMNDATRTARAFKRKFSQAFTNGTSGGFNEKTLKIPHQFQEEYIILMTSVFNELDLADSQQQPTTNHNLLLNIAQTLIDNILPDSTMDIHFDDEINLALVRRLEDQPLVWNLLEIVSSDSNSFHLCLPLVRCILSSLIVQWENLREERAKLYNRLLSLSTNLLVLLRKARYLPSPLNDIYELFPYISTYDCYMLMLNTWNYLKQQQYPLIDNSRLKQQIREPQFIDPIRFVIQKNIQDMVLMTMIGRVADGLPLAASVHNDIRDESGKGTPEYQNQAKNILRRLTQNSPSKASIETDPYIFHCLIDHDVCYLTLCEKSFSRKNAFAYLEDIAQEFIVQYGQKIQLAARPYSFIEFDNYIQKMKKQYSDSRSKEVMGKLRGDLRDVQNIMLTNIHDVLSRGETLQTLDTKANRLASLSQQYRKDANYLNRMSSLTKVALSVGSIVILALLAYEIETKYTEFSSITVDQQRESIIQGIPSISTSSGDIMHATQLTSEQCKEVIIKNNNLLKGRCFSSAVPCASLEYAIELKENWTPKYNVSDNAYIEAIVSYTEQHQHYGRNKYTDLHLKAPFVSFLLQYQNEERKASTNVKKDLYITCMYNYDRAIFEFDVDCIQPTIKFRNEIEEALNS